MTTWMPGVWLVFVVVSAPSVPQPDSDGDGVPDDLDVCCNTPAGVPVNAAGRPIADLDLDCDVDLEDFAYFVSSLTGPLSPCPVDECALGTHDCDPNAACADLPDGYSCTCKPGFEGDGFVCADINECAVLNPCGDFGVCRNDPGDYTCLCNVGFRFTAGTCVDIDECGETPDICGANAICTNDVGTYSCDCEAGFSDCAAAAGCETSHRAYANTCGAAEHVGSFCGDENAGFLCPAQPWTFAATRTGRTSRWFRSRAMECSDCCADVSLRIQLASPPGADYDLYVYTACGTLLSSSRNGMGQIDEVVASSQDDCFSGDAGFDLWIEVRYYTGATCDPWNLTVFGR